MDEEKYQKELFEFEKPKRAFPRLSDFFPKADFERNVVFTLTLDRVVFIAIGIIMIMVVVYALGVEAGKIRPMVIPQPVIVAVPPVTNIAPKAALPTTTKVTTPAVVKATTPVVTKAAVPAVKPVIAVKAAPAAKTLPVASNVAKPYTIVTVTFTNKDNALQEIAKLKKQGFDASFIQRGNYFLVCVGAYTDKAGPQSQKDLKKLRRLYKDAYLRMR